MNNVKAYRDPKSGLRLLLTKISSSESCAVSLMIRVGSIYEPNGIHGGAHVIEHMMFKGTTNLPNKSELARALDSMGASYNAYTDYTMTSYHIKVQKKYLGEVIKILCQMVSQSLFREEDLVAEKPVVVEELRRERDNPAAFVQELFYQTVFKNGLLGKPIGGTIKDVEEMMYGRLRKFWQDNYTIDNMVLSVAGNAEIEEVMNAVIASNLLTSIGHSPKANGLIIKIAKNKVQRLPRCLIQTRKSMKQVQLALGFPCFGSQHPERFALQVLRCILGGNMSSRLFISLRDVYSLAYTVSASQGLYDDIGEFSVSSGVDATNMFSGNLDKKKGKADALAVIFTEIFKLVEEDVKEEELTTAKEYLKGILLLEFEDNQNICEFYGKELLMSHPVLTIQAHMNAIDKVTIRDVRRVAKKIFVPEKMNLSLIGNIDKATSEKYLLSSMEQWSKRLKRGNQLNYLEKNRETDFLSNQLDEPQEEPRWFAF